METAWTMDEIAISLLVIMGIFNTMVSHYVFQKYSRFHPYAIFHVFVYVSILIILVYTKISTENFFFEVSPTRKKCLMEQVSRKNFGKKMPCKCCQKGTVGGIPPNYAEWLEPSESDTSDWHRPDHVEYVSSFSNAHECDSKPFKQPVYVQHL